MLRPTRPWERLCLAQDEQAKSAEFSPQRSPQHPQQVLMSLPQCFGQASNSGDKRFKFHDHSDSCRPHCSCNHSHRPHLGSSGSFIPRNFPFVAHLYHLCMDRLQTQLGSIGSMGDPCCSSISGRSRRCWPLEAAETCQVERQDGSNAAVLNLKR